LHSTWGNGLNNRTALFIDGVNLHASARALGFDVDFKRLIERFRGHGELLRAFYYTTTDDHKYPSVRPLIDWLDYNGYTVVAKATRVLSEASGRHKAKANIDIELVVNAMEIAGRIDHITIPWRMSQWIPGSNNSSGGARSLRDQGYRTGSAFLSVSRTARSGERPARIAGWKSSCSPPGCRGRSDRKSTRTRFCPVAYLARKTRLP
jgi:hypothetical protein